MNDIIKREDLRAFIQSKIYVIRGQRVMLDFDLAAMYGVETRVLNQSVKRNIERFPEDFMFQLTKGEFDIWKSQNATSNIVKNQEDTFLISQIVISKPYLPDFQPYWMSHFAISKYQTPLLLVET